MKNLASRDEKDLDELPSKFQPKAGHWKKYSRNDYPWTRIRRFLRSNVGKPWDEVYSKFCSLDWILEKDKNIKQISHSVNLNSFIHNGSIHIIRSGWAKMEAIEDTWDDTFYVHPDTKILCFQPKKKLVHFDKNADTMRVLGNYHQLLKLDGIWYEVKAKPIPSEIVEIDGLHYKPVKWTMFTPGEMEKNRYKIVDGKVLIPVKNPNNNNYSDKSVGPKDRLIKSWIRPSTNCPYQWDRLNYNTIKITLYRQLNSIDLKKFKIKNDLKLAKKHCLTCGAFGECQHSYSKII